MLKQFFCLYVIFWFVNTLLIKRGKFGSSYLSTAAQEQRYPFRPACAVFSCVQCYGCQCSGSLTCVQMLAHAITQTGWGGGEGGG